MSMYPIASVTVGAGGGTPQFFNIPQTFDHLQIRVFGRGLMAGNAQSNLYTNWYQGTSAPSTYSSHRIQADGSSVVSAGNTGIPYVFGGTIFPASTAAANIFGGAIIDILDYTNTTKFKTVRIMGGNDRNGSGTIVIASGLIQTLNPINFGYVDTEGTFAQGTRVDLYGIADSPATGA
jgi:hypothetical protein